MLLSKKNLNKRKGGFTLIELLVTLTIFSILTGVVLFNQQKFNSTILLTNLAYDTALTIRQAQTYGINIKEFNTGQGGNNSSRFVPYGVHFNRSSSDKSFVLFADIEYDKISNNPGDGLYLVSDLTNCSATNGCVNIKNITRGNKISAICAGAVPKGKNTCVDILDRPFDSLNDLSISYKRPNPNAIIRYNGMAAGGDLNVVTIILAGADGESFRKVRVWVSGLIEIVN
jgi:prepilin-type N-terminal cleavage/methylation domain-containing protein